MATEAPRDDLPFADRRPELWGDRSKCSEVGLLNVNKVIRSFRHDNDALSIHDSTLYNRTLNGEILLGTYTTMIIEAQGTWKKQLL